MIVTVRHAYSPPTENIRCGFNAGFRGQRREGAFSSFGAFLKKPSQDIELMRFYMTGRNLLLHASSTQSWRSHGPRWPTTRNWGGPAHRYCAPNKAAFEPTFRQIA